MPSYIRTRSEFAVNSFTAENQTAPSVSTFADGGFVVTWVTGDPTQDGNQSAIKAQLFDSAGSKVGPEFRVNSAANGQQFTPRVETLDNGNFLVTWVTNVSDDGTNGIKAQLFDRSGDPIGAEFQVNATGSSLFEANVTSLADGGFVISWDDWSSQSVKAQMFDPEGARVGAILTLATTSAQGYGDIIGLANGGFVATFRDSGTSWDVKAQIFNASGGQVGGAFLVNTVVAGSQNSPRATALADGGFVITWSESNPEYQSGNTRIKAQVYTASGEKVGGELLVSTTTAYTMGGQVVTALPDGGFLIAWHTTVLVTGGGSDSEVRAQRFTGAGAKVDGEFQINTLATGSQWIPDLATLADGRVIAVWASGSGDLGGQSVRAQILGTDLAEPLPNTRPVIISNGGGTSVTLTHDEGVTAVTTVVASDDGEPNNLRYSITGGASADLFTINALTGALSFRNAPDHVEGADNFYSVTVTASDGELTGFQSIQIAVRHVNYVTIVSDGGDDYATLSVDENQTGVTIVSAVDDDGLPLTYSITGGEHASFFTIDAQTGALSFTAAPDYESPVNWDNAYYVQVTASDGTRSDSQELAVYVNDVDEPEPFAITSDGAGDQALVERPENGTAVTVVTVSGGSGPVTYEIAGGYDASLFTIDAATGELSFVDAPDFEEVNGGWGSHYSYFGGFQVVVRATDGISVDEQELKVVVKDVDEAPVFLSYSGQAEVALTRPENGLAVATVMAKDPDQYGWVGYALDGADADLFDLDPNSGALSFRQGPNFEAPADADGDNVYEVAVFAYSGPFSVSQAFSITVVNQYEPVTITTNGGGSAATVNVLENGTAVTTVKASGDGPIHYQIAGGADASYFTVNPATGAVAFKVAPDYDATRPPGGPPPRSNTYDLIVRATNGPSSDDQRLSIRVQNIDEAPFFLSYGGQANVALTRAENGTTIGTVLARDPEGSSVTYGVVSGADAALFAIDPSGALRFKQARDFETPADSNGDNVYQVTIVAFSGGLSATQSFSITISDVNENVTITSNGGGDAATVAVAENGTAVTTVVASSGVGPMTYSIVGGADAADFAINASTGALAFASAPNYEWTADADHDNVYEVVVRASNGMNSDVQNLSVNLTNVDENPDFFDHEAGVIELWAAENRPYVGILQAYDIDGGPAITYSVTGGADGALFAIDPAGGELSFLGSGGPDFEAPADADGDNVYEVEVTATQGSWSRTRAFTVTVENENERPVITSNGGGTSAALELDEGQTAVTTVTSVDDGPNPVTYSITGGPNAQLFAIDSATGALSFIAAPDYEAPFGDSTGFYTVEVTASDGLLSTVQSIQISVRDVEEAVTITSGASLSVDEENGFVARILATDGDADPISWSIVGGADAAHFMIDPGTGDLTTRTLLDFEAPTDADGDNVYEVTVRASDGQFSDERQMSVTVNDVDDDLEIVSYEGADLVSLTLQETSFYVADLEANMSSFWGVTFSIGGGADADLFRVDPNTGLLSFAYPFAPDYEAPGDADGDNVYDVTVVANRLTTSDSQTFAITIANRNEHLSITSPGGWQPTLSIDEGDRVVTTVVAIDQDGDVPAYSIVGGADAALFAIDAATGVLTFIAAPDYETPRSSAGTNSYIVEVGATDGQFWGLQTIRIQIGNVNEAPLITSGGGGESAAVTVNENSLAVTSIVASDVDGNPLTYSIVGGADASRFTIESWSGALRFVQEPNFEAPGDAGGDNVYDVIVSVTDGLLTDSQAVAVTVANLNEAVAITSNGGGASASVAVAENGTAVGTVAASDPDGGAVTYAIAGGVDAERFTINASTGVLAFVAAPNFEAPADAGANNVYDVVVSASDGSFTDTQALAVTVGNVNEAVTITSNGGGATAAVALAENVAAVAVVAASDLDGGAVTYAIVGGADAARFTIDAATGYLAFIAAPNFEAPADSGANNVYDVIVSASDGSLTDTQALAVTIGNVNEALAITSNGGGTSASISVGENGRSVTIVAAADPDGTQPVYAIVGGADAARFTINAQTGLLQFVTAPNYELPGDANGDNVYNVIVQAGDGQFADTQALSVSVANVRDGNIVTGTNGSDSINGTSTNPALRTSNSEDTVSGRDGNDTIQGLGGDDWLAGDAGNDTLTGGAGADRLTGGAGKDQFVYTLVSDSAPAARDVITDFSRSQSDKISLSGIDANSVLSGNQAFTFIGSAAFSGAAGQLRFEQIGGNTFVSGDVNGDRVADFQIELSGIITPVASDFVL